jgi:hypothetical protein
VVDEESLERQPLINDSAQASAKVSKRFGTFFLSKKKKTVSQGEGTDL